MALLNSVRLAGHEGEFVVLDCGLTARQRERLATHCRVEQAHRETGHWGYPLKPVAWRPEPHASVVVMIDSDIIVTGSLDPLLQDAAQGKIAMFVDLMAVLEGEPSRAFPEWQEVLELTSPLRRQPYLNSGLIAFSVPTWPGLVNRWAKACHLAARAAEQEEHRRLVWSEDPFGFPEQDSLNAILMSEVPPEALALYDYELAPITQRESVRIEDAPRLRCVNLGRETLLLHNTARPKAWERRAWVVQPYRAFADLLRRVLLSPDVRLRLEPAEVPLLLRPGLSGAALRVGARSLRGLVRLASRVLPPTARSGLSSRVRGWSIRSTRGV